MGSNNAREIARHAPRAVDSHGGVYLTSDEQLTSEDVDGAYDVYYVRGDRRELITPGTVTDSIFGDASADGEDVYFKTRDRLVGIDRDDNRDYYTARLGGGLPGQAAAVGGEEACSGDGCQGAPSGAPRAAPPGSIGFAGSGNASAGRRGSGRPVVARVGTVRGSMVRLRVRVSGAGRIKVGGRRLRLSTKATDAAGAYRVALRLSARGKRALARRGRLTVRARVTFVPRRGAARSVPITVTFRSPSGGERKGR